MMRIGAFPLVMVAWCSLAAPLYVCASDMPSGESLIARSIASEGGEKALAKTERTIMTGTVELIGHNNISGPLEIYQAAGKAYTVLELPGIGKIEEGFDGQVAWESNVLSGPRIKDKEELEATKRSSQVSVLADWKDFYKAAVTVGLEDVNGKPAWKVAMTPTEGGQEYMYFDRDSGLLVKLAQTLPSALGDIPVEMIFEEYREVDGVKTPFLISQLAMGQNMAMRIEKVTYNADIPASRFDLPADVKALGAKQKP